MTDLAALMAKVDLATLVERGGVQLHGQGERYGACPKCGGEDRFHVRTHGDRDWFFCRQCHPKRGDAIDFLCWRDGITKSEAIQQLKNAPSLPQPTRPAVVPGQTHERPPSERWQRRGSAFVQACADFLWTPAGEPALTYLRKRGLSDDNIRAARLGYNRSKRSADGPSWGLAEGLTVNAVAGIVIPCEILGDLWSINIRQMRADVRNKYVKVTGSKAGLYGANALTRDCVAMLFEGEFDSLLAQQHAARGVACVTFGTQSKLLSLRWLIALKWARRVLVAYDNDDAGDAGFEAIRKVLPRAERVHVPEGKDLTEYWQRGGDVASWLQSLTGLLSGQTYDNALEAAVIEWLDGKGYAPTLASNGAILAAREVNPQ